MDLFAGVQVAASIGASSNTGVGHKRRAVERKADEDKDESGDSTLAEMCQSVKGFSSMVKLILSNAQRIRMIMGVLFICYKVPLESPWIADTQKPTQKYAVVMKKLTKEDGKSPDEAKALCGLPHVHAFSALVTTMISRLPATQGDTTDQIKAIVKTWSWKQVNKTVRVVKIDKMFDMKSKKLTICSLAAMAQMESYVRPVQVDKWTPLDGFMAVKEALDNDVKVKEMEGQAPSGDLERQLQDAIDSME